MSSSRRVRGRGRGRGKRKGRGRGQSRGGPSSTHSSSSNLLAEASSQNESLLSASVVQSKAEEPEVFVGLDVGSSFIKIAVVSSGGASSTLHTLSELQSLLLDEANRGSAFHSKISFLADDTGQRCIPSVITVLDSTHCEILLGSEAVKSSISKYKNCIYHSKHLTASTQIAYDDAVVLDSGAFQSHFNEWKKSASKFGMQKCIKRPTLDDDDDDDDDADDSKRKESPQQQHSLKLTYQLKKADGDSMAEFMIDGAFVCLLKKIFKVIASQTGSTKLNVVSSVPFYYTRAQTDHYAALLHTAGFHPLQIVCDHSASIMALQLDTIQPQQQKQTVLCLDFGTFSSQFVVLEVRNGLITSSSRDKKDDGNYYHESNQVSGCKLDECLLKWLIRDFEQKNRGCFIEIENAKARLKLFAELMRIKQVLSSGAKQVNFDIESLYEGIDYHFQLTLAKFESVIYDVMSSAQQWIQTQLQQYARPVDAVVVSGGLAEVPRMQTILQTLFAEKLSNAQLTAKGISPTFINAYGCAMQAATLSYVYLFQNAVQSAPAALHSVVDVTRANGDTANSDVKLVQKLREKNAFLQKTEKVKFNSFGSIQVHYSVMSGKKKEAKLLQEIARNETLPFDAKYEIAESEVKQLLNGGQDMVDDVQFEIAFSVDVLDENGKPVMERMEQVMNGLSISGKKKTKAIAIEVTLDGEFELTVSIGSGKTTFDLLNKENESDDEEEDDEEEKENDNDDDDDNDVVDID